MDIIKANEVRKMTDEKQTDLNDTWLEAIMNAIIEAAEKGEYSIVLYDEIINKKVKNILIEAGYSVECATYLNESRTVISWEEK